MLWQSLAEAAGLARGGAVRNAVESLWSGLGLDKLMEPTPARQQASFTIALIALSAKLAKADGIAVKVEAEAFERCFRVPHEEIDNVKRVFNLAKQDVAGFQSYADQIAQHMKDDPELRRDVFECLFHVATADGILHTAEEAYLRDVAVRFGLDDADFRQIKSLFVRDPSSPYEVLGLSPGASDADVKARHRQLVLQHHPDKLIAEGVPPEFLTAAERTLANINAAYDQIRKERGS